VTGSCRQGIEPPTRGFSARCRVFQGFINQSLAASCRPLPKLTKAQSWHTQSELVTPPSQLALVNRDAPRSLTLVKHLWFLGHNLAFFPNVNRCSVHTSHFSRSTCGTLHPTTDTGCKALRLLWRFSSLSKANSALASTKRLSCRRTMRPAAMAASSGRNGEFPFHWRDGESTSRPGSRSRL
jgi:hypothetical protein